MGKGEIAHFEQVENTVGKGETARFEKFLFSHSVFKILKRRTRKNQGLFGKGLSSIYCSSAKQGHMWVSSKVFNSWHGSPGSSLAGSIACSWEYPLTCQSTALV